MRFTCVSKVGTTFLIYILHGILTSQKNRHDFTLFLYWVGLGILQQMVGKP